MILIYLDNAATTKPCNEAVEAAANALKNVFGNPSSLHGVGIEAEITVSRARKAIADSIGVSEECVYFTSGATESNNLALFGTVKAYGKRLRKIVTTAVEHPSVSNAVNELEKQGFEIVRVMPDKDGKITADAIFSAVDENTCLVSCMLVNNETGYILPVAEAFMRIRKAYPQAITHCDAVQGYMKLPIKASKLNADIISLSGHKIYASKGIGAIYIKKGVRVLPVMFGGGQEKGLRSGTENVPAIAAMGEAVRKLMPDIDARLVCANELSEYLKQKLATQEEITINSGEGCFPYINSISVRGLKSETLLHFLESRDIFVSSGSACSKGKKSSVLEAFGIPTQLIDSTIRISFSNETTHEDIDKLCLAIDEACKKLCKIK